MAAFDEARHLLATARRDWNALRGMGDIEVFADEIFGFQSQQAVEKALQAWLSFLGAEYPKTHDLTRLLGQLEANGQSVDRLQDFVELNPFAVQFRYGTFDELGDSLDRDCVAEEVGELLRIVEALIDHPPKREA